MSRKKAGTNEFTPDEKVAILREIEVLGNVSKVAQKWGVSRQSIYNWQAQRSKLEDDIRIQEQAKDVVTRSKFDPELLKDLDQYRNALQFIGHLEERKEQLSAKVEFMLIKVTTLLENHRP